MGRTRAVVGQVPHFGPPLEKISKRGAKNGGIPSFTKSGFQHPKWFLIIKKYSYRVLRWKETLDRAWWLITFILSAKKWTDILPRPLRGSVWPQTLWTIYLCYLFIYGVHQKSHISKHLLSWPPLIINTWRVIGQKLTCARSCTGHCLVHKSNQNLCQSNFLLNSCNLCKIQYVNCKFEINSW